MTELRHLPDEARIYAWWEGGGGDFTKAELREALKEPFELGHSTPVMWEESDVFSVATSEDVMRRRLRGCE